MNQLDTDLMIINNFYSMGITIAPFKTDSPLLIDPNAILARSITMQLLQSVTRRYAQIVQRDRPIEHTKFPKCALLNILRQLTRKFSMKNPFCFPIPKVANHDCTSFTQLYNLAR